MRIITGKARGLKLVTPKNYLVRPTADRVKEALFNIIQSRIPGSTVLDAFAGTGNLGLEAWSRGAEQIVYFDKSRESLKLVRANVEKARAGEAVTLIHTDAVNGLAMMAQQGKLFDVIFSDRASLAGAVGRRARGAVRLPGGGSGRLSAPGHRIPAGKVRRYENLPNSVEKLNRFCYNGT